MNKVKKIFTTIFAVLFTLPALAAKTITGHVIDADTRQPLESVIIAPIGGSTISELTDNSGNFNFTIQDSETSILISLLGYESQTLPATENMGTIELTNKAIILADLTTLGTGTQCKPDTDKHIAKAVKNLATNKCVPTTCISARYKLTNPQKVKCFNDITVCPDTSNKECRDWLERFNNQFSDITIGDSCEDQVGKECTEYTDTNAKKAEYVWDDNDNNLNCKITKCNKNYVPSDDGTKCELSEGPCPPEQLKQIANAISGELRKKICYVTECERGYKVNKEENECDQLNCTGRYKLNADGDDCEDQVGKECTSSDPNAKKSKYDFINNELVCVIHDCQKGYLPNDNGSACEKSEGPCPKDKLAQIDHATAGELKKGICHATECEGGYEPSDGKCVAISGDCDPMPEHATAAHREWDATTNTEICIIDRCGDEYRPSNDRRSCIRPTLTEEESQKKIEELQKNADEMKKTEQSTANKLLGGASIAATGIGGMQLASAIAENRADDAAERDMAAYLATFRCDYGQGRNIMGGETDVQLPGGNNLIELKQQFMELATDLKTRKDALELPAGIESEVILDSAAMGLYDDESLGITDGTYTSLSRALSDPDGADAAEWAQQRSDTKSQLTTGAVMAGVGIVGGVVGNLLINRDAPDEKSDEINLKYEPLKKLRDDTEKLPDNSVGAQCPSDATGTYPDCECTDTKHVYNGTANKCEECTGDKIAI